MGKALAVKKNTIKEMKRHKSLYIMFVPVAAFYILFCYYPMYGVVLGFKDYSIMKGIMGSPWVGFTHFAEIFQTPKFGEVMRNTILISFLKIIFTFPAPIILSLLLNEVIFKRFKTGIQTCMYLPYFISWVIMANIIRNLLSVDGGAVNAIIKLFGGEPIAFMTKPQAFYPMLIISEIWKGAGWGTIIYTASMQGINPELYEAAEVDGCNRFRKIFNITLPCIGSTIVIMFVLALGGIMNAGFDPIFNLYNSATLSVADIIDTYVYRIGLSQGLFEKGTAVGLFKSVINFILLLGANFMVKKMSGSGIYD